MRLSCPGDTAARRSGARSWRKRGRRVRGVAVVTAASGNPSVRVDRDDAVAAVWWSRPEAANAFSEALVEDVLDTVQRLAAEPPRVLVLGGDGTRFSAGFDLSGGLDDRVVAWRFARAEELLSAVRAFPAVTVARVVGPAFGLGADLVAACDYRLGDDRSRFRFPGPRFGVVLGTHQLRARVGDFRATDILLRNELVPAEVALRDGLLTHLLSAEQQQRFVADLAQQCSDLDAETLRSLLLALRPDLADVSAAVLTRSTHRDGVAERIERYRAAALPRPNESA